MVSKRGRAARVDIYLGPRAFYKKDMEKRYVASQVARELPPRCVHCRRSWETVVINGAVHCKEHYTACDGTCGRYDDMENDGDSDEEGHCGEGT